MSADNWSQCPRCTATAQAELEARHAAIQSTYGKIPVAEFDAARQELADDRTAFERQDPTFREDYGFYGADTGVVTADYSGQCKKCGLKLVFTEEWPIPGLVTP